MKGTYLLLLQLDESKSISIGRSGVKHFNKGFYAYVGSALNGLEARVNRHLSREKKHHWHIDYLLDKVCIYEVVLIPVKEKLECTIATAFKQELSCISHFGSSDCRCSGHLFFTSERDVLDKQVTIALVHLGLNYYRQSITHFDPQATHQIINR
jgi:Uri superfamily endonuclease